MLSNVKIKLVVILSNVAYTFGIGKRCQTYNSFKTQLGGNAFVYQHFRPIKLLECKLLRMSKIIQLPPGRQQDVRLVHGMVSNLRS